MGLGTGATAAIVGGISAAGGIASSAMGSNAAGKAATQESNATQQGIQAQQQMFAQQQANQQPYLQAGKSSLSSLMQGLQSGQFGAGSTGQAPTAPGAFTGQFQAPTLDQARQTPGYQFTQQQGDQGILAGASAAGGNISGNTFHALDQYNSNLADTSYGNIFNQALQTYGAGVTGYQANLSDYASQLGQYQANLGAQSQAFGQAYAPVALGEQATQNINATGSQSANNISSLLASLGQNQAAGTIGSENAIQSGIANTTNSLGQTLALSQVLNGGAINPANVAGNSGSQKVQGGGTLDAYNQQLTNALAGQGIGPG